jgi:hypothetical protein
MSRKDITVFIDINGDHVVFENESLMHQLVDKGYSIFGISLEAISAFRRNMMECGCEYPITEDVVERFFNGENYENQKWRDVDGSPI